jgi:hypothetical protein
MKRLIRLFAGAASIAAFTYGCQERSSSTMYMHLQGGFSGDDVIVKIDGSEVYHNDSVVTFNLLGIADIDSSEQANGMHEISVNINNGFVHTENHHLTEDIYVGINLNPIDSSITFQYSTEPYYYD